MQTVQIDLNEPQSEFLRSQSTETFLVAGVGTGKSFILGYRLLKAMQLPGTLTGLFAPTIKTLRNATLKQVTNCWGYLGLIEGTHYVINRRPPASWGVEPYSLISSNKVITTRWGSYCLADGLDNFDSQRGAEFDEVFVDEMRDVRLEARDVLLGRIRGKTYREAGKKHRIWYATTPPDNPLALLELHKQQSAELRFVFGTTFDNQANLPQNYIQSLTSTLDELTLKREVYGELIRDTSNLFLYAFETEKHLTQLRFTPGPIYLAFDFNISKMSCIAAQHDGHGIRVVREFTQANSHIEKFIQFIKPQLPTNQAIYVTGDASGNGAINAYSIIRQYLNIPNANIRVPRSNPSHAQSRILCNSIFQNHSKVYVDARCSELIEDIRYCAVMVNTEGTIQLDKSDLKRTHLLDCLRYYLNVWHGRFLPDRYR